MMELQLGLAPPSTTYKQPKQAVDSAGQPNRALLQLGLGLCHPLFSPKKRNFDDAFENYHSHNDPHQTLPLLLWHNNPNDEDNSKDLQNNCSFAFNKVDEEDDGIVGWPPIKLQMRKKKLCKDNRSVKNGCPDCEGRPSNSMFVKVKMEGAAIARKIDLSRHNSFQTLKPTLFHMFEIYQVSWSSYELIYQDTEGDWLLAEDVSWRRFIGSVQRLKLVRSSS